MQIHVVKFVVLLVLVDVVEVFVLLDVFVDEVVFVVVVVDVYVKLSGASYSSTAGSRITCHSSSLRP